MCGIARSSSSAVQASTLRLPCPALPSCAKLRYELGGTLHVTIGQDHCLSVYSDEGWARFNESLKGKSFTEIKRLRMMYAYMTDCVPDAQGRILLPAKLRQYANLEKEVVIIGIFDRAEIWNAALWQKMDHSGAAAPSFVD